ncbi:hypothetical protein [Microbacterium sp. NPDC057650]|uniref:hypothetical protein n=1 Tax=unclassified Microbacterium TaxID=2609290 RepID=UPI00366CDD32
MLKRAGIIGGSVLVGIIVAVIGVGILNAARTPDVTAEMYLTALSQGRANTASTMVAPGVPTGQQALLSDEGLAAADHRIKIESVKTVSESDQGATVDATVLLDGARFTHSLSLERGDNEFLLLKTWRVSSPWIVPIGITTTVSNTAVMGHVEIPVTPGRDAPEGLSPLYVYPGVYTFTTAPNDYFEAEPVTVIAAEPTEAVIEIAESPTASLSALVLKSATNRVTACATVPTNLDEECPYALRQKDLASMKVTAEPTTVEIRPDGAFQTGTATIRVQRDTSFGFTPPPSDVAFTVTGTVEFSDVGDPKVTITGASNGYW